MSVKQKVKNVIKTLFMMAKEKQIYPVIVPTDKDKLLYGKVALITGGSSGIGLAIAKAFLASGAKVIISGSNQERLDKAINLISSGGGDAKSILIDVRNTKLLPEKIETASSLFEENRIDILVNSAGVVAKHDFWNTDSAEYENIMDTNAKGTFFMSQAVGKQMIQKNIHGHILNVTSSSALRPAWTPYQMSKWTVKGLTLGLADMMIPYGIVVNAIAPGPTATPMLSKHEGDSIYEPFTPSKRYSTPEELASLAVFMVSGAGNMIVGDTVYMTGGSGTITMHH